MTAPGNGYGHVETFAGAESWDGETYHLAPALPNPAGGIAPSVVQMVGRNNRRRGLTIINNDTSVSVRVSSSRDKAEQAGRGVTVPPRGGIVISTRAEVYLSNDDTAASPSVAYFEELDS